MQTTKALRNVFKAIRNDTKRVARKANESLKFWFADYRVMDDYGTRQICWTMKGAMEWLPYCSNNARIISSMRNNAILAQRVVS